MKTNLFILIVGFVFGLFVAKFFSCSQPCIDPPPEVVTEIKYLPADTSAWRHKPEPVQITVLQGARLVPIVPAAGIPSCDSAASCLRGSLVTDTPETFNPDTTAWNPEQWIVRSYNETYRLPNGTAHVESIVGQNKLLQQRVTLDSIKQITVTKTAEKLRNQVYLGFNIMGSPSQLLTGAGPSVLIKTKSEKMLELGALYGLHGISYQAGIKLKISLKK